VTKKDLTGPGLKAWDDKKREIMDGVIPASVRKESNPKDDAAAGTRLDLSLFPDTAVVYGALAMTEGHLKYGGYNYRVVGVRASVYISACGRHFKKWIAGEWADPETKIPHLASALACIAIIIDAHECGKLIDDRPPAVKAIGKLFGWAEEITKHLHSIFPPKDGPGRFTEEAERAKQTNNSPDAVHDSAGRRSFISDSSGD